MSEQRLLQELVNAHIPIEEWRAWYHTLVDIHMLPEVKSEA